jgi:transposase
VGMLVSRDGWVPLLAKLYRGNHNDVTTFPRALEAIGRQCRELGIRPETVTLVADKGNLSANNWQVLDASRIGHVVSLVPSLHGDWAYRPAGDFTTCEVAEVGPMDLLRGQAMVAGRERTVVVLDSPTLRDGQMRGLQQQLGRVMFGLTNLRETLARTKRRRRRRAIERQIERILRDVATVRKILAWELVEREDHPGFWDFDWWVDPEALAYQRDRVFGRRMLATDRGEWSSGEIVWAYWGQSEAELVFRQMKDPHFLALRPQHHWTDQKIEVHSFCCVVGYLLAALVRRHARKLGYREGLAKLLEMLTDVRAVLRTEQRAGPGRPRVRWQLEEAEPRALRLYQSLTAAAYQIGPTPKKS